MNEEIHHLAATYAVDALDDDERLSFEAHLPTCQSCSAEVDSIRESAAELAELTRTPPPNDLKHRLMAEIATTEQVPAPAQTNPAEVEEPSGEETVVIDLTKRSNSRARQTFFSLAAAIVLIAGALAITQTGEAESEIASVLEADDAQTVVLEGDSGSAEIVWSPSQDTAVLTATGLGDPGDGNAYELWLINEDGAAPTGLFLPDTDGAASLEIQLDGADPQAWGITIEPDTGSEAPTGDILLHGEAMSA